MISVPVPAIVAFAEAPLRIIASEQPRACGAEKFRRPSDDFALDLAARLRSRGNFAFESHVDGLSVRNGAASVGFYHPNAEVFKESRRGTDVTSRVGGTATRDARSLRKEAWKRRDAIELRNAWVEDRRQRRK